MNEKLIITAIILRRKKLVNIKQINVYTQIFGLDCFVQK